jgi:hypothetical protein
MLCRRSRRSDWPDDHQQPNGNDGMPAKLHCCLQV